MHICMNRLPWNLAVNRAIRLHNKHKRNNKFTKFYNSASEDRKWLEKLVERWRQYYSPKYFILSHLISFDHQCGQSNEFKFNLISFCNTNLSLYCCTVMIGSKSQFEHDHDTLYLTTCTWSLHRTYSQVHAHTNHNLKIVTILDKM